MSLPINAVLPALLAALRAGPNAVLVAPPGAGKTTMVAPALLEEPWCSGKILLLSPRRLAARAAAERMAELLGGKPGGAIGYATRMDTRQSTETRILVVTEGVFRNRIQSDPELAGVSAVLFDEVHERSLEGDFGLALALDAQNGFRPDLRLLAMSATLDGGRFSHLMGGAPVIESAGRSFPLTLRHIGRKAGARLEDEMAGAIRRALTEEEGDLLAFLPGVAEISRTAERLSGVNAAVLPLHGGLDPAAQRAVLGPCADRKVILATAIAETSLTIDGVRIVVDSGLSRRPRHDKAAGVTRLVTERVSQASATQRAGRAARQGPGVAYRLWEEAATSGLIPYDPPEILEAELTGLVLDCAIWGLDDPVRLAWLDPPPPASVKAARRALAVIGAMDGDHRPTAHGKALAQLALSPAIAHMVIRGAESGLAVQAAELAIMIGERGLGGSGTDLPERHARWHREQGARAKAAQGLADRLARQAERLAIGSAPLPQCPTEEVIGLLIATGFPDRLARRRDASGEHWQSVGGRGFRLDPADPLARAEWLAVADVQGAASGARITSAAAIVLSTVEALFADTIKAGAHLHFDPATGGVKAESGRWLGAIRLSKGQDSTASPEAIAQELLKGVRAHELGMLPWLDATEALRTRAAFAGIDCLSDEALLDSLENWLAPLLIGKRRLAEVRDALPQAMLDWIGWDGQQELNRIAPAHFVSPAGQTHDIDYAAPAGPTVTLRVQALFGLAVHPLVGKDRIPLVLSLTSPAGRPIQTTRDLPGFWAGSWADVAKEMRGRYPRHHWPDDPAAAVASLKTKRKQGIG